MDQEKHHTSEERDHAPSPSIENRHAELHHPNEKNIQEALSHHVEQKHPHVEKTETTTDDTAHVAHDTTVKLRPSEENIHTKERNFNLTIDEEFEQKRKEYAHEEREVAPQVLGHPEKLPQDQK